MTATVIDKAVADLLVVAARWASADDWGVQRIYTATLRDLAELLAVGFSVGELVEHAGHVGRSCCRIAAAMDVQERNR